MKGGSKQKMVKNINVDLKEASKWFLIGASIFLILTLGFSTTYTISAGQRGVLLTFGKANDLAITEGLHFKIPFAQQIIKMDVKTQKYEAEASSASQDLQVVKTNVAVNYYLEPETVPRIYREIGIDYQNKIIQPAVQEVVKATTAEFNAEQLITKRPEVKDQIETRLKDRLVEYGINVQNILITNFDFSESFNQAIEAKVTAEQNALAAKNKLEQVKYEADQRVTQAKGEAEAIKIQAEAITAQGGKEYVQLQAISKWDGKMPQFTGGGLPFISIPSTSFTQQ